MATKRRTKRRGKHELSPGSIFPVNATSATTAWLKGQIDGKDTFHANGKMYVVDRKSKTVSRVDTQGALLYGMLHHTVFPGTGKNRFTWKDQTWEYDSVKKEVRLVPRDTNLADRFPQIPQIPNLGLNLPRWQIALLIIGFIALLLASMLGGTSSETIRQSSPGVMSAPQAFPVSAAPAPNPFMASNLTGGSDSVTSVLNSFALIVPLVMSMVVIVAMCGTMLAVLRR